MEAGSAAGQVVGGLVGRELWEEGECGLRRQGVWAGMQQGLISCVHKRACKCVSKAGWLDRRSAASPPWGWINSRCTQAILWKSGGSGQKFDLHDFMCLFVFLLLIPDRGGEEEKKTETNMDVREKHQSAASCMLLDWGPNLQATQCSD